MEEFITFIVNHWKVIALAVVVLLEIVILILKKPTKILDNSFIAAVAGWIEEAEHQFVKGEDKLNYVLEKASAYLGDAYDRTAVKNVVEWLLTLPQKKR